MKNATVMNEVQGIQKVLEEYLGNRKAAKVAVELSVEMLGETQHTHSGEVFFVHKDEAGKLVLTMESAVKENVLAILNSYLEEDEVQECLEHLMGVNPVIGTKADNGFETIKVEGSNCKIYTQLMNHRPENYSEGKFKKHLGEAINATVNAFEVFVCDPSIDENGKLQFVPGFEPAAGYSYNELEKLAKENGVRLGTKNEYCLFLGTMIVRMMADGWSEADAWKAVCYNSNKLGHYCDSADAKDVFEPTGSRMIVGKCDLANAYKILAKDEKVGGFWLAGGDYNDYGNFGPLADLFLDNFCDNHYGNSVGWFVL